MISENIKIILIILTIWMIIDSIRIILPLIKLNNKRFNLSWNIIIILIILSTISNYLLSFIIFIDIIKFIEAKIIMMVLIGIINIIFIKYTLPKILKTEISINKLQSKISDIENSIGIDIICAKNKIGEILNNNE